MTNPRISSKTAPQNTLIVPHTPPHAVPHTPPGAAPHTHVTYKSPPLALPLTFMMIEVPLPGMDSMLTVPFRRWMTFLHTGVVIMVRKRVDFRVRAVVRFLHTRGWVCIRVRATEARQRVSASIRARVTVRVRVRVRARVARTKHANPHGVVRHFAGVKQLADVHDLVFFYA